MDSPFIGTVIKKAVATGKVMPRKKVALKSQVSGVVEKTYVSAGQYVQAGQLIARIKIIPDLVSVNNAENEYKKARLMFANAKKEYIRQEKLYKDKVLSEKEFSAYVLDYQKAETELTTTENNLQLIKVGAARQSGSASNLVKSTVDGMVLEVPVEEGGFVIESNTFNEGTTIASIADMKDMIFSGKIEEADVEKLKEGMPLILQIGAIDDLFFQAELEFISPQGVDEEGVTNFEIRAALQLKPSDFIRAGYSANADIILDKREKVLCIRERLVQFDHGKPFVEIETAPHTFTRKYLTLGLSDEITVEVTQGLTLQDKIKEHL